MIVIQINATCGVGSTGKICLSISQLLIKKNIENYICFSTGKSNYPYSYKFCNRSYQKIQALKTRLLRNNGFNAKHSTKKLIRYLEEKKPDIVHIHNIHSNDVNLEMLFNYLQKNKIKTLYTFHDCWAFTAYCSYFTLAKCHKWLTGCNHCPYRSNTSWFFDKSKELWNRKKNVLTELDLTIITPSQWLADLVIQSFFKDYAVKVINNGIDLSIFKPTQSDFREKYNLQNKFFLLGVAFGWGERKGLDIFIDLSKRLDSNKFQIVLVGATDEVDKQLPENIISIRRTDNQQELAELYSACDLFVNPTREENYPTVNMESIACGTAVLTFRTGGSHEILTEKTGSIVECDDIDALEKEIIRIERERPFKKEDCVEHAKSFDMNERFEEYVRLYKETTK